MNDVVKVCKKHSFLSITDIIKCGIRQGKQQYKCKKCMKEQHKKYYEKNKEKILGNNRKYREQDIDRFRNIRNASRIRNYPKYKERERISPQLKRKRQKKYDLKQVSELGEAYLKRQIKRGTKLKSKDIPENMVKFKRVIIQIKRKLKEIKE